MSTPPDPRPTRARHVVSTVVLCLVSLSYATLEGMVVPAVPYLQQAVGASPAGIAWVLTGLFLTGTVASPLIGRLADVYGPKRVLLTVLGLVALGTSLASIATSMVVLALGQALQGFGLGFVPLSIAILSRTRSGTSSRGSVGLLVGATSLGTVVGSLLVGPLLGLLPFRFIYWIPLAVQILIGLVAIKVLVPGGGTGQRRVDWAGAALLSGGLVALLLGVTFVPTAGWGAAPVLLLLAAAVVLLAGFVVRERRIPEPLVDLRLGGRSMTIVYVTGFTVGWAATAAFLLLPVIVSAPVDTGYGLGDSALTIGVLITVYGLVGAAAAPLAAPLDRLLGSRLTLMVSSMPIVAGTVLLLVGGSDLSRLTIVAGLIGLGGGLGTTQAVNIVVGTVPTDRLASATSTVYVVRGVGSTLGSQVTGSLLTIAVIPQLGLPTSGALTGALLAVTALGVIAVLAAGALPGKNRRAAPAAAAPSALAG